MISSKVFLVEGSKCPAIFFLVACLFIACNNSEDLDDQRGNTEPFVEGKLDVSVEMVNNPMYDIYRNLDLAAGNLDQQMEDIMEGLSEEEKSAIQDFVDAFDESNPGNLGYTFSILFHAINSKEIYVQNITKAAAKYNTLQYHGEIQYNTNDKEGRLYMKSHSSPNRQLTFNYSDELYLEGGPQTVLTEDNFNIDRTGETGLVSGYLCKKTVYSMKNDGSGAGGYLKVEAWVSEFMPQSINYVMPYMLSEQHGIMKMVIHHMSNENYPIVYEVTNLTPRQVTDQEISILQSEPQYYLPEDKEQINSKILEILFQ